MQLWTPPLPTRATRLPALKSRYSNRGRFVNPKTNRVIVYESTIERKAAFVLLARPDVIDLHDQPPPVVYLDEAGKLRYHTFDFLAFMRDRSKIAIAVKPLENAERKSFRATLNLIARQTPKSFADRVGLVTDRDLHPDAVYNATLIQSACLHPNDDMDQSVRRVVAGIQGAVTIEAIVAKIERTGQAFRSVIRLIATGEFTITPGSRITHRSLVSLPTNQGDAS